MSTINRLKSAILAQKEEVAFLLSKPMHKRSGFEKAQRSMGPSLIKVITGPRRSGKSTFALSLVKGGDFIYLNFDNQDLKEARHAELTEALRSVYGVEPKSIVIDEVQNLKQFELWLNELHRLGYNIVTTGSNANLLSSELATHLTGRYIEIQILPFSYKEFGGNFEFFYKKGGFPDILLNEQDRDLYIEGLTNTVVLKDIVDRFGIRQHEKLFAVFNILSQSVSSLYSYKTIAKALDIKSEMTVRRYVNFLENAYLQLSLLPFSKKVKQFYRSPKKSYMIDTAFIKEPVGSMYLGQKLENFVCLELIKSGLKPNKDLFYFKSKKDKEVDFVIYENLKIKKAIQVCFDLNNLETKKREVDALKDLNKEYPDAELYIVTSSQFDSIQIDDGVYIKVVSVEEFVKEHLM